MAYKVDINRAKKTAQRLQEEAQRFPLWIPPEGRSELRFLPPWSVAGDIGYETRWHWNIGPDHKAVPCPHSVEKECPLCDLVKELRTKKDPKAQEMYARKRIYYNIIVRGEEEKGVQVYASGIRVYENILSYLYDDEWGDITDVVAGRDMILERVGQGKEDTQYTLKPKANPSPIHADQAVVDKWLEEIYNLDEIITYPETEDVQKLVGALSGCDVVAPAPAQKQIEQKDVSSSEKSNSKLEEKKKLAKQLDDEINALMGESSKLK